MHSKGKTGTLKFSPETLMRFLSAVNQQVVMSQPDDSPTHIAQNKKKKIEQKQKNKSGTKQTKEPVSSQCDVLSSNEQDVEGRQWLNTRS